MDSYHAPSWLTFVVPKTYNSLNERRARSRRFNFFNCDYNHVNRLLSDID